MNVRLQLAGSLASGVVAFAVVLNGSSIGSNIAGLVIVYAIALANNVTYMARLHSACQMAMNSVERVDEYLSVPREVYEADEVALSKHKAWPSRGAVEFRQICMRYKPSAPFALK